MAWLTETVSDNTITQQRNWSVGWHGWINEISTPSSSERPSPLSSWLVNITASAKSECLTIEVLNSEHQCRAQSDFTLSDLIKLGMPEDLDLQDLSLHLIALCRGGSADRGSMLIEDEIKSYFRKSVVNLRICGRLARSGRDFHIMVGECGRNDSSSKESEMISYLFSLERLRFDRQKDVEIIHLRLELAEKCTMITQMKKKSEQRKLDLERYESEIEYLGSEVDRLREDLEEETARVDFGHRTYVTLLDLFAEQKKWKVLKEYKDDSSVRIKSEEDSTDINMENTSDGTSTMKQPREALFLTKLRQFARESRDWTDLMHAQWLLLRSPMPLDRLVNDERYGSDHKGALHLCAQFPRLSDMMRWLLSVDPDCSLLIDPNVVDRKQMTPLNLAALNGNLSAVKLLLKHPMIDAKKADENGFSPLHWAAYGNHPSVVEALLEHGCDSSRTNVEGLVPLDVARRQSSMPVVELLQRYSSEGLTSSSPGKTKGIFLTSPQPSHD